MSLSDWTSLFKDLGAPYALLAGSIYAAYMLANRLLTWAIGDGSPQNPGEVTSFLRRHIDAIEKIASRQELLAESMSQLGNRQQQLGDAQHLVAARIDMLVSRAASEELFRST